MELAKTLAKKHAQLMLDAERWIWKHPETGYKEWKTHEYLETEFAKLGYELTLAGKAPPSPCLASWTPSSALPTRRQIP